MKKIMVVDDSIFMFEEMKVFLQDTDFEIAGYIKCGEDVVQEYEKLQPDIVTMDIILPGIDGLEATRNLLEKYPDAKVLVISSLAYEDTEEESFTSGAKDFIFKPFEKDGLIEALNKVYTK